MEQTKSKVKLKPESIKKNMLITISLKSGKVVEAYFKRFMHRNTQITELKQQNQYRDSIEALQRDFAGVPSDQFYLFLSSSESDERNQYAKLSSVQIRDIEDIRLAIPSYIEPHLRFLQNQITELQATVKALQSSLNKQTPRSNSKNKSKGNSRRSSTSTSRL